MTIPDEAAGCREAETESSKGGQEMAKAGDELVNPVTRLRTVFRRTARDKGGELLRVDWIGEPVWITGPDHVHPRQEECLEILFGRLGLRVEGVERILGEGEGTTAPAGSAHAAWNADEDQVQE
jgi:hypothetical protein